MKDIYQTLKLLVKLRLPNKVLLSLLMIFSILLDSKISFANNLQSEIIGVANRIIDNKVQIQLINDYINNLQDIYRSKQQALLNRRNEFITSVGVLYKLNIRPKESLLVQNFNQTQILNLYMVTNFWLKHASSQIHKIYLELLALEDITKQLNIAQRKLQGLNLALNKNQNTLAEATRQNLTEINNINQINNIRQNLKLSIIAAQNNQKLFETLDQPILTSEEKKTAQEFSNANKGKMLPPSNGYIYSQFKSNKYYSIDYYGMVFIGLPESHIVAPADGEIVFADQLKNYNTVIIIKHSPTLISIISGDFKVGVKLAQLVHKGEVIATLKVATKPIYFELEENNLPIDPTTWLIHIKTRQQ